MSNHNEGINVLTREDRMSIQSAENTETGLIWIYDNWIIILIVVSIICLIGVLTGKVKIK